MAKHIMQFRYYGDNHIDNQPRGIIKEQLTQNGGIFTKYLPFTQLGIQTLPGSRFYLNNAESPIIVGSTGIYELELEESYSHQRAISFLLVIYIRKSSSLQVCYFMMY